MGLRGAAWATRGRTRWFVRAAALVVGLANLAVLAHFAGANPALPKGVAWSEVSFYDALAPTLAVVLASWATAETILRRVRRNAVPIRSRPLFWVVVEGMCLGGFVVGVLLSAVFVFQSPLMDGHATTTLQRILLAMFAGIQVGTLGAALGLFESLILAYPLAKALVHIVGGDDGGDAGTVRPSSAARPS